MKLLILFAVLLSLGASAPKPFGLQFRNLYKEGKIPENSKPNVRIIGGREATPHSIPYQAYMEIFASDRGWRCGGVLISTRFIITAAHCLVDAETAHIILGAHNVNELEDTQVSITAKIFKIHEYYSTDTYDNDIGLIKIPDGLKLDAAIGTIGFDINYGSNYVGKTARMSGWGETNNGQISDVLQYVDAPVMTNSDCSLFFGPLTSSLVCTSGENSGGACSGDSGGPLVLNNILIGIASFAYRGCLVGTPTAFTRINHYGEWINYNIQNM